MARLFDDASTEYLGHASILGLSAWPITFACWVKSDAALNQGLICFGDIDDNRAIELRLRDPADSDVIMYIETAGDTYEFAKTSSTWSLNTWHHVCGIVASDISRSVFLDGGSKGTDVDNIGWPAGMDNMTIGASRYKTTIQLYVSGHIAEVVIWNVALTDAEVLAHATGVTAWQIRPQNLVFYAPLIRSLNDEAGGLILTPVSGNSGPIVSPHPRIIEEGSTRGIWAISAPPEISIPVVMKHLREQGIA